MPYLEIRKIGNVLNDDCLAARVQEDHSLQRKKGDDRLVTHRRWHVAHDLTNSACIFDYSICLVESFAMAWWHMR